jgi:AcrR family transcriptional regulator
MKSPANKRTKKGMPRLKREERERQILEGAIRFFSEHGFNGQTRELARQLSITQPLLYQYFPSKQALIEKVYEELFLMRWRADWEALVVDRKQSLRARLTQFYHEFQETIFSREWVRMFVYAGLDGVDYNRRTLDRLETKIFRPVCVELRLAAGYPATTTDAITPLELEYIWHLHGRLFYWNLRRYVYAMPDRATFEDAIELMMDDLFTASSGVLDRLLGSAVRVKAPGQQQAKHRSRAAMPVPKAPVAQES